MIEHASNHVPFPWCLIHDELCLFYCEFAPTSARFQSLVFLDKKEKKTNLLINTNKLGTMFISPSRKRERVGLYQKSAVLHCLTPNWFRELKHPFAAFDCVRLLFFFEQGNLNFRRSKRTHFSRGSFSRFERRFKPLVPACIPKREPACNQCQLIPLANM